MKEINETTIQELPCGKYGIGGIRVVCLRGVNLDPLEEA